MNSSVKLLDTLNVALAKQLELAGETFTKVKAIADGNCAFNAFALALIELIITGKLKLDEENQQAFLNALQESVLILEERIKLYRGQENALSGKTGYSDLATPLANFVAFIKQKPDYAAFSAYVQQHARHRLGVAALHIGLARALRDIAVTLYKKNLQDLAVAASEPLQQDADQLYVDGNYAGQESLSVLAQKFKLNLNIFNVGQKLEDVKIAGAETVNLVHVGAGVDEHWDYLLPAEQKEGFAKVLAQEANPELAAIINETESQVQQEETFATQFKAARVASRYDEINAALTEAVNITMKTSENLIKLKAAHTTIAEATYQSLLTAHTKHSDAMLRNVRKSVDLTKRNVESLRMATKLQESLLMGEVEASAGPLPDHYKQDETLARAVQNAEILSFLSQHYSTLTKEYRQQKVEQEAAPKLPTMTPR